LLNSVANSLRYKRPWSCAMSPSAGPRSRTMLHSAGLFFYIKFVCRLRAMQHRAGPWFSTICRIARDQIAQRWINWSNFGPTLYDLKKQSIKISFILIGDLPDITASK
jgi:hypothetical protein